MLWANMYPVQIWLGHIVCVFFLLAAWCLHGDSLREVSNFLVGLLPHILWFLRHLAALKREINVTWFLIHATFDFLGAFKITKQKKRRICTQLNKMYRLQNSTVPYDQKKLENTILNWSDLNNEYYVHILIHIFNY